MAKMFYTIDEAAERLDVNQDQIKHLVEAGKLHEFRDRDKLMFKRDEVDSMATEVGTTGLAHVVDEGDDSGPIALDDTGEVGSLDLMEVQADEDRPKSGEQSKTEEAKEEDPRSRTGISVFDAEEVQPADPMAQTQVTESAADDEELVLESIGSGSGLLDLTRESDDTSLGAELLEEIYPGSGEGSDAKLEPAVGSTGSFEGAIPESGASGLENLQPSSGEAALPAAPSGPGTAGPGVVSFGVQEAYDPAGSGFSTGTLLGATIALVIAFIVAISAIQGVPAQLTSMFAQSQGSLWMYCGVLLIGSFVLGVIGLFLGKAFGGR